jgi:hypothetical protein
MNTARRACRQKAAFRADHRLLFSYQLSNIPGRLRVDDAAQSFDLPMAGFLAFTDANTSVAFAFR